jgi:hypothetical protein
VALARDIFKGSDGQPFDFSGNLLYS